jgi:F-type H+-transporting ATPase subunit delta
MSSESAAASSLVKLNFALPHETIYNGTSVYSVICPGLEGEYGITANHVPYVGQLKPGVLQILHEENTAEPEKYFVAGGYALTHADSTTVRNVGTLAFANDVVNDEILTFILPCSPHSDPI